MKKKEKEERMKSLQVVWRYSTVSFHATKMRERCNILSNTVLKYCSFLTIAVLHIVNNHNYQ